MDKNIKAYRKKIKNSYSYKCDILKEDLPHVEAQVVIADPPWYLEHMKAFMWAAAQITKIGGYLLLCIPPVGTKPDIIFETNEIFDFAKKLGFTLIEYKPGILSYETPLFEINALKADGVKTIPQIWRRGNYALFSYESKKNVVRPVTLHENEWIEIKIKDTRIKVRRTTSNGFNDPSLIQLVSNDILPTVRRSDDRRKKADVWTSGNRIFACNGKNILIPILISLSINSSPFEIISQILKRGLEPKEYDLISSTVKQIDKIVESEQKELKKHLQSMRRVV